MKIIFRGDENLRVVDALLNPEPELPIFHYGKKLSVELEFYHENGIAYTEEELNKYEKFLFGVDTDSDFITPAAALTIAGFTVSGNTITFYLWTASARFKQLLGSNFTIPASAEFKAYLSGETLAKLTVVFPVTLENGVCSDGSDQEPPKFQFSVDGIDNWHDEQADTDQYIRVNRNDGTEWSAAIKLPVGPPGAAGEAGSDGAPAQNLQIEYSIDGANNWHTPFAAGDLYLITSVDGGNTWSAAIKFVGQDGNAKTASFSYEVDPTVYVPFWGNNDYSVWKEIPLGNSDANNNINGASMTNSQITLPAGTYIVNGLFAISLVAGSANIRLRNITGSATLIYGPAYAAGTGPVNMQLSRQKIVLTETTVLEFQIYHTGRLDLIYNTADYGRTTRNASIIFEKIG